MIHFGSRSSDWLRDKLGNVARKALDFGGILAALTYSNLLEE
jgi:hypothetical protein